MKTSHFNINRTLSLALSAALVAVSMASCNKDLPEAEPIRQSISGKSIATIITDDTTFSYLKAAIARAGTGIAFNAADSSGVFTVFAPNNDAFRRSGIPSVAAINGLPAATVAAIVNYHVIPGVKLPAASISTAFPNNYYPSAMVLAPASASLPFGLRNPIFPSKRTDGAWVNQIPITATDIQASNGVIHTIAALLSPPARTIKQTMRADSANYSLLLAAITRADSGIARAAQFDSLLNFAVANFTVFAPTNDAFRALFPAGLTDQMIIGALNTPAVFTATAVRGLLAYHLLGVRAFSVNFPTTPTPINTLLSLPTTPPTVVPVIATRTGAAVTVKGLANATASNVTQADINNINGVIHRIDQVLRPQ